MEAEEYSQRRASGSHDVEWQLDLDANRKEQSSVCDMTTYSEQIAQNASCRQIRWRKMCILSISREIYKGRLPVLFVSTLIRCLEPLPGTRPLDWHVMLAEYRWVTAATDPPTHASPELSDLGSIAATIKS